MERHSRRDRIWACGVALACGAMALASTAIARPAAAQSPRDSRNAMHDIAPPSTKGLIPRWTGIIDSTGRCRFSVPPQWTVEDQPGGNSFAAASDGTATAEADWLASSSWSSYRAHLRDTIKATEVHEDSPSRFWVEYLAGWPGAHHYVAIPSAEGVCALQVDVRVGIVEVLPKTTLWQIVRSLVALP